MAKYKIDPLLDKQVKDYMSVVIKKLEADGSRIDESWNAPLYLMAENYNTVIECNKLLKVEGLTTTDRFGGTVANPIIKIKNDAQIQMTKLLVEFLLTKKQSLKVSPDQSEDDSPLMQFVSKNKVEKR